MFKASFTRIATGKITNVGKFETTEEAQTWVDKHKTRQGRRTEPFWAMGSKLTQEQIDTALDSEEVIIRGELTDTRYLLPAEASVTITDITQEVEDRRKEQRFKRIIENVDELIVKKAIKDGLTVNEFRTALRQFYQGIFNP